MLVTIFENTAKTFVQPLPCLSRSIVGLNVRFAPGSSNILIFDKNFSPNQIFALERSDSPEEVDYYYYETTSSTTPTVRKRTKPKRKTMETIFEVVQPLPCLSPAIVPLEVSFAPSSTNILIFDKNPTPPDQIFALERSGLEEEFTTITEIPTVRKITKTIRKKLAIYPRRLTRSLSKRTRSGAFY